MNTKTKRRMMVVGGIIIIVIIVLVAVVGGSSTAKIVSVADLAKGGYADQKVQVQGMVVDNSYSVDEKGVLTFDISDENDASKTLHVTYDKGVSATFGNGIVAMCTGRMGSNGTLTCSELVTKCPSKYESATEALTVDALLGYGSSMIGKTTKVSGTITGEIADATQAVRFTIASSDGTKLPVSFTGALPDEVTTGAQVVITGALENSGTFLASAVSLEG